jgi:alpha-L-rhamnosidase
MFQYYGDTTIIKRYYNPLKQYLKYLTDHSNNHLLDFGIDDHKPVKIITDPTILSSGFYYHIATILSKMAIVINSTNDKIYFDALSDSIKNSFNEKYYNSNTNIYGNGGQTSLSEALYFDLTTDDNKASILKNLIADIERLNDHFDAGVVGIKFITNVLTHGGKGELLYKVLNKRDYPSFGNWIENGATTLWQEWDGSRSLNHMMFGSFSEFFYEGLAGINSDLDHPGFKHFYITPSFVKSIDWVKSSHQSPFGKIQSDWTRQSNEIIFEFSIPTNSKATVRIPSSEFSITSGEKVLNKLDIFRLNDETNFHLGSGSYKIVFQQ